MIFSLVAMTGLEKCYITSAYLHSQCYSGERPVARGPLVSSSSSTIIIIITTTGTTNTHTPSTDVWNYSFNSQLSCLLLSCLFLIRTSLETLATET